MLFNVIVSKMHNNGSRQLDLCPLIKKNQPAILLFDLLTPYLNCFDDFSNLYVTHNFQ